MRNSLMFLGIIGLAVVCTNCYAANSSFTSGAEGWTAQGDIDGPLAWVAAGGNPGGHVTIDDATTGGVTYFVAPSSFRGNFSGAIGTVFTFDLQQIYTGSADQFNSSDIILQGGGLTIAYDTPVNPANGAWTSYAAPLIETDWRLNDLAGAAVTGAQFATVLGNITSLRIRAEYQTGADTGKLDNVTLVPEPSSYALLIGGLAATVAFTRRKRAS